MTEYTISLGSTQLLAVFAHYKHQRMCASIFRYIRQMDMVRESDEGYGLKFDS